MFVSFETAEQLRVDYRAIPRSAAEPNITFSFPFCKSLSDGHVARPPNSCHSSWWAVYFETVSCLETRYPSNMQPPQALKKTDGESSHFNKKKKWQRCLLLLCICCMFSPISYSFSALLLLLLQLPCSWLLQFSSALATFMWHKSTVNTLGIVKNIYIFIHIFDKYCDWTLHSQVHRQNQTTALCTWPHLPISPLNFNFIIS